MSQKVVAAVLAGIGLTLLAISGVGFMLLSQTKQVAVSEGQARASAASETGRLQPAAEAVISSTALGAASVVGGVTINGPVDFGSSQKKPPYRLLAAEDEPTAANASE